MRQLKDQLVQLTFSERTIPLAFLVLTILGFGLLTPNLGYYQDDWPYVFYAFNKGIPSLTEELYYDSRPNAAWLYILAFQFLGFKPFYWHIAALLMRWLTGTILWKLLRQLWPGHTRAVTYTIILFLIHPFFLIQPSAVNSMLYWAGYFLYSISMWIMARNTSEIKYRGPLTILAVILSGVHLFTSEYYVGMELARPLILYWLLADKEVNVGKRLTRTLTNWLPYLSILIFYAIWRIFLFVPPPGGDRNAPVLLFNLFTNTSSSIYSFLRTALQDSLIITVTSWYRTINPELLTFATIFDRFVLIVSIATFLFFIFYLIRVRENPQDTKYVNPSAPAQRLILGVVILILGILPLWIIGQDIVTHKNQFAASRFGIGSTLGAAMILAGIVEILIDNRVKKIFVISLCAALAVNFHLYNSRGFRFSWEKQIRFYQQLVWRAPRIEPGTALVTDQEILPYMGPYAVSFGTITAYQPGNINTPPYWYFPFYYTYPDIDNFMRGIPIEDGRVSMSYNGWSTNSLIFNFESGIDRCLWILRPEDVSLRLIGEDLRKVSAVSALGRIQEGAAKESVLPEEIFGKLANEGWCYYFEKADLARQYGKWDEVIVLWEDAMQAEEQPGNGFEYVPFIEGYAHLANWEMVKSLTRTANKITQGLEPTLCESLDHLMIDSPPSSERELTIAGLKDYLKCSEYQ